jgi:hypothetical protein
VSNFSSPAARKLGLLRSKHRGDCGIFIGKVSWQKGNEIRAKSAKESGFSAESVWTSTRPGLELQVEDDVWGRASER